jgi:hypothetical protein
VFSFLHVFGNVCWGLKPPHAALTFAHPRWWMGLLKNIYIMTSSSSSSLSHRYPSICVSYLKLPFYFKSISLSFPLHCNFGGIGFKTDFWLIWGRYIHYQHCFLLYWMYWILTCECQLAKSWILSALIHLVMYCFIQSNTLWSAALNKFTIPHLVQPRRRVAQFQVFVSILSFPKFGNL